MSAGKVTKSPAPNYTGFNHIGFTITLPSCNRKVSLYYLNKSGQKNLRKKSIKAYLFLFHQPYSLGKENLLLWK